MSKPIILCIDDDATILYSLREQIIRGVGDNYQIELAQSGKEALELCADLNEEGISLPLVICDQIIPDMLGDEILSHLHQLYPETLKILLTGQANFQGVIKAVNQANLYRYIAKPWQEIDLILTVKEALQSYQLNQQLREQNQTLQQVNQELQAQVQKRQQTEQLLKASEARLESILNSLEDVVWSTSVDNNFELLYLNPSAEKLYGYPIQTFLQNKSLHGDDIVHPEDQDLLTNFWEQVLSHHHLTVKYRIVHPQGQTKWVREQAQVIYDHQGNALRIDGTISDITKQKLNEEELAHAAFHDALTGLPNRAFFLEQLKMEIKRSHLTTTYKFAILFLDLDGFKEINDNYGHDFGDLFLITIAQRLQKCLRDSDLLSRLGGDEFTIILRGVKEISEVKKITERLLKELAISTTIENKVVQSSASIGIVFGGSHYYSAKHLLKDADSAMYQAKRSGKDCFAIFERENQANHE